MKFNPTTKIDFYAKESTYTPGQGQSSEWKYIGYLYGEWRGAYGEKAAAAQALGVNESATIRTFYHPEIYTKLQSVQVIVAKHGADVMKDGTPDKNNPNSFELWGGVDNVKEANLYMEFRVRRYEGK
jgi:hypothetical protein